MSFKAFSQYFVSFFQNWSFFGVVLIVAAAIVCPLAPQLSYAQRAGLSADRRLDTLLYGIVEGDLAHVDRVLEAGIDVNQRDRFDHTPLLHAARVTGPDGFRIVDRLIEYGADVNARDAAGNTPLMMATFFDNRGAAVMLLRAGADPNAANCMGLSPVQAARNMERPELIELLERYAEASAEG